MSKTQTRINDIKNHPLATSEELAEQWGISPTSVRGFIRYHGLNSYRKKAKRLRQEFIYQYYWDKGEGETLKKYRLNPDQLKYIIKKLEE